MSDSKQKLYFIECEGNTKIGISDDPERRVKEIQTGNAYPCKLAEAIECVDASAVEAALHKVFEGQKISGEWYNVDSNARMLASRILNGFDDDSGVGFIKSLGYTGLSWLGDNLMLPLGMQEHDITLLYASRSLLLKTTKELADRVKALEAANE